MLSRRSLSLVKREKLSYLLKLTFWQSEIFSVLEASYCFQVRQPFATATLGLAIKVKALAAAPRLVSSSTLH